MSTSESVLHTRNFATTCSMPSSVSETDLTNQPLWELCSFMQHFINHSARTRALSLRKRADVEKTTMILHDFEAALSACQELPSKRHETAQPIFIPQQILPTKAFTNRPQEIVVSATK